MGFGGDKKVRFSVNLVRLHLVVSRLAYPAIVMSNINLTSTYL